MNVQCFLSLHTKHFLLLLLLSSGGKVTFFSLSFPASVPCCCPPVHLPPFSSCLFLALKFSSRPDSPSLPLCPSSPVLCLAFHPAILSPRFLSRTLPPAPSYSSIFLASPRTMTSVLPLLLSPHRCTVPPGQCLLPPFTPLPTIRVSLQLFLPPASAYVSHSSLASFQVCLSVDLRINSVCFLN